MTAHFAAEWTAQFKTEWGAHFCRNMQLVRLGYRILEGGADNNEVYNFALFHYASVGILFTL